VVNDRMDNAYELAQKCWAKAYNTSPEFVEGYLELAKTLLASKPVVLGDEFRANCRAHGLARPKELHPNVWVSGVRALKLMGWISPIKYVVPTQSHNHMPVVTMWKSTLYNENSL